MLWIIWGMLCFAIVTYLVVINLSSTSDTGPEANEKINQLPKILGVVAVVNILISLGIRKFWTLPLVKKLDSDSLLAVLPSCVVSWAMAEAVSIYGLVLGFTGEPISVYGIFMVASFGTMMFLSPNFKGKEAKQH